MKKLDAYLVYLILSGMASFAFSLIFTVNLVYQATTVGLNPLQLVLVGTVLETACFIFEVPTGVVADLYSRRLSVILGTFLIGLGFALEGSMPLFAAVLLAQVIWGLGATFTSGATEAWIADELGEARAGPAYLRGAQIGQLAALVGIALSVGLASIWLQLPIILGGVLHMVLAGFLVLAMPENGFTPTPPEERHTWQGIADILRRGVGLVRRRPALLTILAISAVYGMYSEGFDRLWTPHLLEDFSLPVLAGLSPIVWFGIISAVGMLLAAGATEVARRQVDTDSHTVVARSLFAIYLAMIGATIAFGLAGNLALALAAYWATTTLRTTGGPLFTAWLNQHIESRVRATVFSMSAQLNAVGQIVGGPILGVIATVVSLPVALAAAGVALTPTLLLYERSIRRDGLRLDMPDQQLEAAD